MTDLNDVEGVSLMPFNAAFEAYKVRGEAIEASVLCLSSRAATASQTVWAPLIAPVIPAALPSYIFVKIFASKILLPMDMWPSLSKNKNVSLSLRATAKIT